jgi:3-oxoacyl-(acyl-carrier-protein) synthase
VSSIESFPCDDYATRFAGEIKGFQCNGYVSKKNERRMDNCIKYTMVAGKKVSRRMHACRSCMLCTLKSHAKICMCTIIFFYQLHTLPT